MKKIKKEDKGITLIALVLTIIVLLLLAGISISMITGQDGIVNKAVKAKESTEQASKEEKVKLLLAEYNIAVSQQDEKVKDKTARDYIKGKLNAEGIDTSDIAITDNGEFQIGLSETSVSFIENNIEVGHYVSYNPDNNINSYFIDGEQSGYDADGDGKADDQTINKESTNWRVLKNDGTNVVLISEKPINKVGFGEKAGYLNGISLLDEMCEQLYSSSKGTARCLKLKDINEITGYKAEKALYNNLNDEWIEVAYNTKIKDIETDSMKIAEGNRITPNEQELGEFELNYYTYNGRNYKNENNEKACNLLFETNSVYWISDRNILVDFESSGGWADFNIFVIDYPEINEITLWGSDNCPLSRAYNCRPIIILNSDIEIDTENSGDGSSSTSAWKLK